MAILGDIKYIDMDINDPLEFKEFPGRIVLVTSFLDIGRGNWKDYSRNADTYIRSFLNYLDYEYEMIIFIDERYHSEIVGYYNESKYKNKTIIPINKDWCNENLDSWKKLNSYNNIMSSDYYKGIVGHRITSGSPENISPEYNIINHSKIDFLKYCIDNRLSESDFFCWTDFGYFNAILQNNNDYYPKSILSNKKFNYDKISFFLRNKIEEVDADTIYTLINSPEKFTGSFWGGNTKNINALHSLYHESLDEMMEQNIADDDQHVYLKCFLKNPGIFQLYLSNKEWPKALKYMEDKKYYTGKKFFDCGTHFFEGFEKFAKMYNIDDKWKCYCFEANPITYSMSIKKMKELIGVGHNIDYFNLAVTNKNTEIKINCALDSGSFTNQGSNILDSPPDRDIVYGGVFNYNSDSFYVRGLIFSDFLKQTVNEGDFVVIKMDIEGSEFDVMDSLIETGTFKLISQIYVEYHERFFEDVEAYSEKKKSYERIFKEHNIAIKEWE
jgi:hypothetical protein